MGPSRLSRGKDGAVRIDYSQSSGTRVAMWEPISNGVMHTIFNGEGAIVRRDFFECLNSISVIDKCVSDFVDSERIAIEGHDDMHEVALSKNCPSCNETGLLLEVERKEGKITNIPVMPVYKCNKCGKRSYYLTDEYLDHLVSGNIDLFKGPEQRQMQADKEAFRKELKEYIIRIFASKRIVCIR